jgi:regulator of chromosome condensation (RCC1) repeat-containing protein/Regulator of Chromosome Condensation (RCC1) repeat protein
MDTLNRSLIVWVTIAAACSNGTDPGDPPANLLVSAPQGDLAPGLPVSLTVTVQDAAGNRVGGSTIAIALAMRPNAQGAKADGTITVNAVDGVATFTDVRLSRAGRAFAVEASAGSLSGVSPFFDVRLRLSSISVTSAMACGLSPLGDAYCWGRNATGGLGIGRGGADRARPTLVAGDLVFAQLDVGSASNIGGLFDGGACGVTVDGAAYCWGRNDYGQLGNGNVGVDSDIPVPVAGGLQFRTVAAGLDHACGLTLGGAIYCWGSNQQGRLGNGKVGVDSDEPEPVSGNVSYTALSVGGFDRSCGIASSGETYCWGGGGPSPLEGRPFVDIPALVLGGVPFSTVEPGSFLHLCGVGNDAGYCWGQDFGGELGTGTPGVDEPTPAPVLGGYEWTYIGAGAQASCGLRTDGVVMCWGFDYNGELGQGSIGSARTMPSAIAGGITFTQLSVGLGTSCGLISNGEAYCWGAGLWGERGDGTFDPQQAMPTKVVLP